MADSNQHQEPFDVAKMREHAEWTATLGASGMDGISAENINCDLLDALDEIERLVEQLRTAQASLEHAGVAIRSTASSPAREA